MLKERLAPDELPTRKPSILKHAASLTAVYEQDPGGEDVFMQVKAVIQSFRPLCVDVCVGGGVGRWWGLEEGGGKSDPDGCPHRSRRHR